MRGGPGARGVLRRGARSGSRAFELFALSLAGVLPLALTALAVTAAAIGLAAVAVSLVETGRAWAQQYRRMVGIAGPHVAADDPVEVGPPDDDAVRSAQRARLARLLRDATTWRDLAWALVAPLSGLVLIGAPLLVGTCGVVWFSAGVWESVSGRDLTISPLDPPWTGIPVGLALWAVSLLVVPVGVRAQSRLAATFLRPTAQAQVRRLTEDRAQLVDGRARELRRIERDLHDGAQTRLVSMGITLRTAELLVHSDPDQARALLAEARGTASDALAELRTLVQGIHPPVLAERGLGDSVRSLALACPVPSEVTVELDRPIPDASAAAVYFACSELLANVAKHAGAGLVRVELRQHPTGLTVRVLDDGSGGADPAAGTGLRGVSRRLSALDATMAVHSPVGGPTTVELEVPCGS